jgi:hypothetical protein
VAALLGVVLCASLGANAWLMIEARGKAPGAKTDVIRSVSKL